MEKIDLEYLNKFRPAAPKNGKPRSEREEILDVFLARLNAARILDGYPKLSHARLAQVLQGIPTTDLHPFYKQCEAAKHFSRFFWWSLKSD